MQNQSDQQNQQVASIPPSNNQDIESGQQNQQVPPAQPLDNHNIESDSRSWYRRLSSQDYKQIVLALGVTNTIMSSMLLGGMSLDCQSSYPEPETPKEPGYNMTQFLEFKNQQAEYKKDCENQMGLYAIPAVIVVNMGVAAYIVLKKLGYFESRRIESEVNADVVFAQGGPSEEVALPAVQVGAQISQRRDNLHPDTTRVSLDTALRINQEQNQEQNQVRAPFPRAQSL